MKTADGLTTPVWYDRLEIPQYGPPPDGTMHADVVVVGAGIAGLTTAYLLASKGQSVIVIDEGPIGSGQTGRTSAHLASAQDDRFVHIEHLHGVEGSALAYESHAAAIDTIERISRHEKIACAFSRLPAYLSALPSDPPDLLEKELAAARRAGMKDAELVDGHGLEKAECIRFGNQARFHPLRYLVGLAEAFTRLGGKIYTGRRVKDVQGSDPKKKTPAQVNVADRPNPITADHIVVATNTPSPINDWFGIYTKQASYRTYVIAATIPRGTVEDALYWDTADPYHYVRLELRPDADTDLLIIGGEDHKTGQFPSNAAPFLGLETWARERFPAMGAVVSRWSGQIQEPSDGLAFIGRALTDSDEVFVVTGDSGMGLTHGTIGGLLIADLILGEVNHWEKLYDPSRKMMNLEFVRENANTLTQYKDLLTPGEYKSVDEVPVGQGAVIREGLKKIAVYRNPAGEVHRCSAICTHLECVVQWNGVEKSWDCPCHGSRFDALGKVLMGPAIDDLPEA